MSTIRCGSAECCSASLGAANGEGLESWRRRAAIVAPALAAPAMALVFRSARNRFGPHRGYLAGFLAYWTGCCSAAVAITGTSRLAAALSRAEHPLPEPCWLARAALVVPPMAAVGTEFFPHARRAGLGAVATAIVVGGTNAVAEEAFWRAMPAAIFPESRWWGWIWPAGWFTAWHLVPLGMHRTAPSRVAAVLSGAALIGVGYGWVSWATGSVRSTMVLHAVTDSSGVRAGEHHVVGPGDQPIGFPQCRLKQ